MERANMTKLLRPATVLVGAVLLLGAGFPTKTVSPERFARAICTSVTDWVTEIGELGTSYDEEVSATDDLDEKKDLTTTFIDDVLDSTNALIKEVGKAGTPDVPDGKAVVKAYRNGLGDAKDVLEEAAEEAEDLPTDDDADFEAAREDLGTALEEGFTEAGDAISEAEEESDEDLQTAFEDEQACEELRDATGDLDDSTGGGSDDTGAGGLDDTGDGGFDETDDTTADDTDTGGADDSGGGGIDPLP
jgi:hypothetical protein